MIMTIEELRTYITTSETDQVLANKMQALELLIRQYTNNNFQKRTYRATANVEADTVTCDSIIPLKEDDTIQISDSIYSDGLYVVEEVNEGVFTIDKVLESESKVLITKVEYPADIKMGVVNMLTWDLENRKKVGIQSETISRHSVTYFNMDGDNSLMGYPKTLIGFLKPYKKARF